MPTDLRKADLAKKARDPRLDFFRGAALLIIFIAHFRGGWLWDFIPARFGLSDAADLFVFCSGYAAAIAFGGTFARHGFWLGTARIALRCWQLYLAQIILFFAAVALGVAVSGQGSGSYLRVLGLDTFFADAPAALLGIATLRYVPNYFDILPLYIVVLAMVPAAMLLTRISPALVIAASIALYALAWTASLNLPGDPLSAKTWYFNPLCWQLIFFTGFAFSRGWISAPSQSRAVTAASLAFVLLCVATSRPVLVGNIPAIAVIEEFFRLHSNKTNLDLWQYAHFLATAQLAIVILRGRESVLLSPWCRPIVKCGQQALPVFISGMLLSHLCSMILIRTGDGWAIQFVLNAGAAITLLGSAYLVAWFKAKPWTAIVKPALQTRTSAKPSRRCHLRQPELHILWTDLRRADEGG